MILVVLTPLLLMNLTVILSDLITGEAPTFFGVTLIVEKSGAMNGGGAAEKGDLLFIKSADTDELKAGDVIGYKIGKTVFIRRIVSASVNGEGERVFVTKGDGKARRDSAGVKASQIVGIVNNRSRFMGRFIEFAQSPAGIACFFGIPVSVYLIYDIINGARLFKKGKSKDCAESIDINEKEEKCLAPAAVITKTVNENE